MSDNMSIVSPRSRRRVSLTCLSSSAGPPQLLRGVPGQLAGHPALRGSDDGKRPRPAGPPTGIGGCSAWSIRPPAGRAGGSTGAIGARAGVDPGRARHARHSLPLCHRTVRHRLSRGPHDGPDARRVRRIRACNDHRARHRRDAEEGRQRGLERGQAASRLRLRSEHRRAAGEREGSLSCAGDLRPLHEAANRLHRVAGSWTNAATEQRTERIGVATLSE